MKTTQIFLMIAAAAGMAAALPKPIDAVVARAAEYDTHISPSATPD